MIGGILLAYIGLKMGFPTLYFFGCLLMILWGFLKVLVFLKGFGKEDKGL